ncbi:NUDIX domain-containing protein [Streptomyces sp. NPDC001089]
MAVDGLIAGAVVVRAGRVLMIRRAVPVGGLVWQFPAGRVEAGESAAEAAAREASEETGVRVEPVSVIGGRVHPETGRHVVYVACRWVSGEPWAGLAAGGGRSGVGAVGGGGGADSRRGVRAGAAVSRRGHASLRSEGAPRGGPWPLPVAGKARRRGNSSVP